MKTRIIKKYICYALIVFMTTSCDTLNLALASFNQGLGGVCAETECSVNLYDVNTGKYLYNKWSDKNEKGEDVSNSELQWLQSKARQYLNRIGIYYDQSPYTNKQYQFVISCVQWQ